MLRILIQASHQMYTSWWTLFGRTQLNCHKLATITHDHALLISQECFALKGSNMISCKANAVSTYYWVERNIGSTFAESFLQIRLWFSLLQIRPVLSVLLSSCDMVSWDISFLFRQILFASSCNIFRFSSFDVTTQTVLSDIWPVVLWKWERSFTEELVVEPICSRK